MKQIVLATLLFFMYQSSFAQRHYVEDGKLRIFGHGFAGEFGKEAKASGLDKKNVIKLNLSSLSNKVIAVQYERALNTKISFAIQGRYMPNDLLPGTKQLSNFSSDSSNIFKNLKISSWAITPEIRLYFRQALKGFYIAPYARIRNIDMSFPINYTDDNNKAQSINTKASFLSFGGGLMIGSHFKIGKSISLDWFILGGHFMATNIDASTSTTVALTNNDQQDVKDFLTSSKKTVSKFINNYTYDVTANKISIKGNMNGVGFRGAGINLGFRF